MASVNSLPTQTLFSQSMSFKWENVRLTDTCMQGKQLMNRYSGCTIRRYLEIVSKTFGCFNLSSHSTSTSSSANAENGNGRAISYGLCKVEVENGRGISYGLCKIVC